MFSRVQIGIFTVICSIFSVLSVADAQEASSGAVSPSTYKKPQISSPRTTKSAELFSLEAGARCHIRFDEQDLIRSVPFSKEAFKLLGALPSDPLPRYAVTGFSFAGLPVEKVFLKLVKDAGIKVTAEKGVYPVISGKDMKGELSAVLDKIAQTAEVFYTYDAEKKTIHVYRTQRFKLIVPDARPVMLAVLDALRGNGIKDIMVDWDKNELIFAGDAGVEAKVKKLISLFDYEPSIIAFDVHAYKIVPRAGKGRLDWQKMVDSFGVNSIRSSVKGVMGRLIVTESSSITNRSFLNFISQYASVLPLSEGEFMVPDGWRSRFDIGRCGKARVPESSLSLLMKAQLGQNSSITGTLALDTTKGEITNFPFYSSYIGDNLIVIGVPSEALSKTPSNAEMVLVITPKIIRIVEETPSKK